MTSVSTDRRFGVNSGKAVKVPCKVASTANLTLSGEQTIDGVACVTGDRVLAKDQTTGSENGIWVVDTGAWTRSVDADDIYDLTQGSLIHVNQGTSYTGRVFRLDTTGTITPGTTSLSFSLTTFPSGALEPVATLAALQALVSSAFADGDVVYMASRSTSGDGGHGEFAWNSGDKSTEVAADEVTSSQGDGGLWIAPASDKTGASGAWRRSFTGLVDVAWYGSVGTGDESAKLQKAIDSGYDLEFNDVTYSANNLTQTTDYQRFIGRGNASIQKNANGDLLTSSGDYFRMENMGFRGDASTPVYTGHNIVLNGDHPILDKCGSRWAYARAVKATGEHVQILATNDIYQTADATSSGYDIEITKSSGAASLYHQITDIYTSQAAGGIYLENTGTASIKGGQFGKLKCVDGVGGAGVSGPYIANCRINGAVDIIQANTKMSNLTSSSNITLGDGVVTLSGVCFADSCSMQSGTTLTLNDMIESDIHTAQLNNVTVTNNISADTNNNISIKRQSFTPAWTGAVSDPAIGNGSISAYYSRIGRKYTVGFRIVMGSTTTFGSGEWRFGLPDSNAPITSYTGSALLFDNGTAFILSIAKTAPSAAYIIAQPDSVNSIRSTSPFTWASGDAIDLSIVYEV